MLFSEDWLRSYINPDLTTEELAESLTMAGLEVEEVQKIAPDFTGVVATFWNVWITKIRITCTSPRLMSVTAKFCRLSAALRTCVRD